MFSKPLLTLLALLALAGCSIRLNDRTSKPVSTPNTGAGCLAQAGDVFDRYHKGELSAEEHEAFFGCAHKALNTFVEYADGKNRDYYEPGELSAFLTKYFLGGKPIHPGLVHEAMALKRAMIGGPDDRITREELRRTIAFLGQVKRVTGSLRPLMPLTPAGWRARSLAPAEIEKGLREFEDATLALGTSLETTQGEYPFDRMAGLARELQSFFYGETVPAGHWTKNFLLYTEALRPVKAVLISPPREGIAAGDWPKIYRLGPRYFTLFLRAQLLLSDPQSAIHGEGLARLEDYYAHFLELFHAALNQHPDQRISSRELDDMLSTLAQHGILPCEPAPVQAFLRAVFGKLFGQSVLADFNITKDSLTRFQETTRFGLEGLHALDALFAGARGGDEGLTRDEILATPSAALLESTHAKNALSLEAIEAIKRTPGEVGTVFPGRARDVLIPARGLPSRFSHLHLAKMHLLRSLNRLLVQAYGGARATALTETQVASFLNDIFPMIEALGIAGPDMRASISKRLLEASLFLYSSDGDEGLTMNEALELEALVISTLDRAPRIHADVARACALPTTDERGASVRPAIPSACYVSALIANSGKYWAYIPGFAAYFGGLPAREQGELVERLERFLRKGKTKADPYVLGDSQALVLFPYYVELLFSRFDQNQDGKIDFTESQAAYPVFRPFIAEKAGARGYRKDEDHQAIFNFLLSRRVLPTEETGRYGWRRYLAGPDRTFTVDRGQVVEIFEKLLSL